VTAGEQVSYAWTSAATEKPLKCVASGTMCTVQLGAGIYLTRQLVTYNFKGALKGAGQNSTIIKPVGQLNVCQLGDLCSWLPPDTGTHLWPTLVIFVDGNITISDISFSLATAPSPAINGLPGFWDVIRIMGSQPVVASIRRVSITGAQDPRGYFVRVPKIV